MCVRVCMREKVRGLYSIVPREWEADIGCV